MTWLTENPWPFLLIGLVVEIVLVLILLSTGRGALLSAIAGVAVLNIVLLVAERVIVTDRERIAASLDELAAALANNDVPAVLEFIAPAATAIRRRAEHELPLVKFNDVKVVSDVETTINETADPPSAVSTFNGRFSLKYIKGGTSPYEMIVRRFRVTFQKLDGRWLITDAEESHVH
jgi:hypothetical protein